MAAREFPPKGAPSASHSLGSIEHQLTYQAHLSSLLIFGIILGVILGVIRGVPIIISHVASRVAFTRLVDRSDESARDLATFRADHR